MENQSVRFMFSGEQTALMWNILKEILIKGAYKEEGKKPLEDLFKDMTLKLEPYLVNTNQGEGAGEGGDEDIVNSSGEGEGEEITDDVTDNN